MPRRSSTGSDRVSKGGSGRVSKGGVDRARKSGTDRAGRMRADRAAPAVSARRVLHLDTFSGIAGNMFAGALIDLGLRRRDLEADLAGLDVPHALRITKVKRGPLAGRYFEVRVPGQAMRKRRAAGQSAARADARDRSRSHAHDPHDASGHDHGPHRARASHEHTRSYLDIVALLGRARLRDPVRRNAMAIFEALGRAEASVHGVSLDAVHFHEVGAVDAIVDVTTAAIGIDRLGIDRVTATPVALGHGTFESAHGRLPLPAPATLALLAGIPTVPAHVPWETVTPTGAAILRVLVDEFTTLPAMTISAVGIGAGNDRPGPMPNVLRAVLGTTPGGPTRDRICVLETNLDDLVPEHFDHLMDRLFEAGALDVSIQHIQMKKNRPGFLVRVLARPADRDLLSHCLFAESTAIGVRSQEWDRLVLERESREVATDHGRIGVKLVFGVDGALQVSAEYDDCKRAARRTGAPLRDVVRAAEEAARREFRS